jgi:hypothetical protein
MISNLENLILWLFHFFISRKIGKAFRIKIYLKVIAQIAIGTILALVFFMALLVTAVLVMNGKIFGTMLYSNTLDPTHPRVFWDYFHPNWITSYNSPEAIKYRTGRLGLSFMVAAVVILYRISHYIIGC